MRQPFSRQTGRSLIGVCSRFRVVFVDASGKILRENPKNDITPPKFNSLPLKNDVWKPVFRGYVKFSGCNLRFFFGMLEAGSYPDMMIEPRKKTDSDSQQLRSSLRHDKFNGRCVPCWWVCGMIIPNVKTR